MDLEALVEEAAAVAVLAEDGREFKKIIKPGFYQPGFCILIKRSLSRGFVLLIINAAATQRKFTVPGKNKVKLIVYF